MANFKSTHNLQKGNQVVEIQVKVPTSIRKGICVWCAQQYYTFCSHAFVCPFEEYSQIMLRVQRRAIALLFLQRSLIVQGSYHLTTMQQKFYVVGLTHWHFHAFDICTKWKSRPNISRIYRVDRIRKPLFTVNFSYFNVISHRKVAFQMISCIGKE